MPRPKNPAKKPLTMKERKLVAEYVKTGNKKQSAIAAGYSPKSAGSIADETLRKPNVQVAVQSAAEKLGINHEFVLGNIKRATEITGKTYTKTVGQGENVSVFEDMVDSQAFLKSNELLGKHLSLFVDKVEVTGKDGKDLIPEEKRKDLARKLAFLFNAAKKQD